MANVQLSRDELQAIANLYAAARADVPTSPALEQAMTTVSCALSVEKHRGTACRPLAQLAERRATEVL